jgi:hypothetical protein
MSNGVEQNFTIEDDTTLGDFVEFLNENGIYASLSNYDGVLTFEQTESCYIKDLPEEVKQVLSILDDTTVEVDSEVYTYNSDVELTAPVEYTMEAETTLAQLGLTSETIVGVDKNGNTVTGVFDSSNTIEDIRDWLHENFLATSVVTDGYLAFKTLDGGHLTYVSDGFIDILKIGEDGDIKDVENVGSGKKLTTTKTVTVGVTQLPGEISLTTKLSDLKDINGKCSNTYSFLEDFEESLKRPMEL